MLVRGLAMPAGAAAAPAAAPAADEAGKAPPAGWKYSISLQLFRQLRAQEHVQKQPAEVCQQNTPTEMDTCGS